MSEFQTDFYYSLERLQDRILKVRADYKADSALLEAQLLALRVRYSNELNDIAQQIRSLRSLCKSSDSSLLSTPVDSFVDS